MDWATRGLGIILVVALVSWLMRRFGRPIKTPPRYMVKEEDNRDGN